MTIRNILLIVMKTLLCGTSMLLTALLLLQVNALNELAASEAHWQTFTLILTVTVGLALDGCKYIFIDTQSRWRQSLAGCLLVLSWFASVAFFVYQDQHMFEKVRQNTPEYEHYQTKLEQLNTAIAHKEQLRIQRLQSSYHQQWDKAEQLSQEIQTLQTQRLKLLGKEKTIGSSQTKQQGMPAFYKQLALYLQQDTETIKYGVYAVLAFMIEVCALALWSVPLDMRSRKQERSRFNNEILQTLSSQGLDCHLAQNMLDDIKQKNVKLQLSALSSYYQLNESEAKKYLRIFLDYQFLATSSRGLRLIKID